jgi:hypothetical protein
MTPEPLTSGATISFAYIWLHLDALDEDRAVYVNRNLDDHFFSAEIPRSTYDTEGQPRCITLLVGGPS